MKTCRLLAIVSVKHCLKNCVSLLLFMNMYFKAIRYVIVFVVRIKDRFYTIPNFICKYIFSYCPHVRMSHKCFVDKINDSPHKELWNFLFQSNFYLLQTHFFLEKACIILQYQIFSSGISIQFQYWWLKLNKNNIMTCSILIPLLWNANFWRHLDAFLPYSVKKAFFRKLHIE